MVKILGCLGEKSWRFKNSWLTGAYAGDYTVSVMNWSVFYCSKACLQHTSRFTITQNSSRLRVIYHTLFLLLLSDPLYPQSLLGFFKPNSMYLSFFSSLLEKLLCKFELLAEVEVVIGFTMIYLCECISWHILYGKNGQHILCLVYHMFSFTNCMQVTLRKIHIRFFSNIIKRSYEKLQLKNTPKIVSKKNWLVMFF